MISETNNNCRTQDCLYERMDGRHIFLFDTNMWIELSNPQNAIVQESLAHLVKSKKIICPLCYTTISEFHKQNYDSISRMVDMIDRLSEGKTFISIDGLFEEEIKKFVYKFFNIDYEVKLFGPPLSCFSSYKEILNKIYDSIEKEEHKNHLDRMSRSMRYKDYVLLTKNNFSRRSDRIPPYKDARNEIFKAFNGNRRKIFKNEAESVARTILIPLMNKYRKEFSISDQLRFVKFFTSKSDSSNSLLSLILDQLPCAKNYVNIMTATSFDRQRNDNLNDFYDIEFMIAGLAYSNIVASRDKWINHLFSIELKPNEVVYCKTIDEISSYIEKNIA
jgi:hypothetical protein